ILYAFVDYLTRLFSPITNMVNQLANLEQSRVASERVFELLEEKGEAVEEERMPRLQGNVKFDNVSFSKLTLDATVPLNKNGSCSTIPICSRVACFGISFTSW
ncbi:hypothetical protein ACT453_41785, partial [Bacillus sp. D-CC]